MSAPTTERKTQNEKILELQNEIKTAISDLTHTMQLFAQEQKGEHCNINKELEEVRTEVFGNGGKQRLREMVTRLWDDAQIGKSSGRTFYLAVAICVITSVLNLVIR